MLHLSTLTTNKKRMEEMKQPVAAQPATPEKKVKGNYLLPIVVGFVAVAAFLLVWYFAVK